MSSLRCLFNTFINPACVAFLLACFFYVSSLHAEPGTATQSGSPDLVIDAVVASVDEKPITLSELQSRLPIPRKLSLKSLSSDQEAQQILEALIAEKVLEAEASLKRVSVDSSEIEDYINEVASRNSLSRSDFEGVLKREGRSIEWYRRQVRGEILKTKLASSIAKGGVSVSEQEIDEYVSANPNVPSGGALVKLRSISVAHGGRSADEIAAKVRAIQAALESGKSFEAVASELSDDQRKAEGGLLGVVAEKDLSSDISGAIAELEAGKYSQPVVTQGATQATQLFFVEERVGSRDGEGESGEDSDSEAHENAHRDAARKAIQKRKTEEKLSSYFGTELQKNHTVDRKF